MEIETESFTIPISQGTPIMRAAILICLALAAPAFSAPPKVDPEINMDPKEIIERWGYKAEEHDVKTPDGYTLKLYRIPYGKSGNPPKNRPVILLQHGFDTSAADWIINLPSQSAGFVFADGGYDVWLGNFRGNRYARQHDKWDPTTHFFWEFSLTEMATKDLPAIINKVLAVTGLKQLNLVAHSTGTTAALIALSANPSLANSIIQFHAISPLGTMENIQGPLRYAAPFTKFINVVSDFFGVDEFVPSQELQESWATYVCQDPARDITCKNVLLMISGFDTRQLNASRIPVYNSHSPSGTSVKTTIHMGQIINSGVLRDYDYGSSIINRQHYGTTLPPQFILSRIPTTLAIYLYSSQGDWVATPQDVNNLAALLGPRVISNVNVPNFNHMDFLWGSRATSKVYNPIMTAISHGTTG